jgi:oligopeptide transport system substrate-binding protein
MLLDAAPIAPVLYGTTIHAVQPTVRGWMPNQLGFQRYKDLWLEN